MHKMCGILKSENPIISSLGSLLAELNLNWGVVHKEFSLYYWQSGIGLVRILNLKTDTLSGGFLYVSAAARTICKMLNSKDQINLTIQPKPRISRNNWTANVDKFAETKGGTYNYSDPTNGNDTKTENSER